jgi:hypothetical protein
MNRKFYVANAGLKRFDDFYVSKKGALLVHVAPKGTVYKNQWILAGALTVFTMFDWPLAQIFDTKKFRLFNPPPELGQNHFLIKDIWVRPMSSSATLTSSQSVSCMGR